MHDAGRKDLIFCFLLIGWCLCPRPLLGLVSKYLSQFGFRQCGPQLVSEMTGEDRRGLSFGKSSPSYPAPYYIPCHAYCDPKAQTLSPVKPRLPPKSVVGVQHHSCE